MISCLECLREFNRITSTHLKSHGLDSSSYREKFPDAIMVDPLVSLRTAVANTGKKRSEKTKEKIRQAKKEQYLSEDLRKRVSEGTKKGMHKPESWERFITYIEQRDISGEKSHNLGVKRSEETKRKISENKERAANISKGKSAWWANGRIGQTVEELYGEDKGKEIRKIRSEQTAGEKNPAFGKVYENTGRKIGRYKGKLFRSVYEYSFYKYLENSEIDLSSVEYEPITIRYNLNGRSRTYHPDFMVHSWKMLVEIKSGWELGKNSHINIAKFAAAREYAKQNNLEFKVMTEKDFRIQTYAAAYADKEIIWIKR